MSIGLGGVEVNPGLYHPLTAQGKCHPGRSWDQGREWHLPRDVRRQIRRSNLRFALHPEEDSGNRQTRQRNCRSVLSRRL